MAEAAVPVVLIAGYLGAGKTTWLNHRIRQGFSPRALILVNDFGAINIDADLIEYRDDRVVRLSNGCICCSLSESLAVQLSAISRWQQPPSIVYIEASGVAQPQRIIDLVRVSRQYRMEIAIGLVDASTVLTTLADPRVGDLVAEQISTVDRLCVNRTSCLRSVQRQAVNERLSELNPLAEIFSDPAGGDRIVASRPAGPQRERRQPPATASRDTDPAWQRFAVTLSEPVCRKALERTLAQHAVALARAKGILKTVDKHLQVFQWSGGHAQWTPTSRGANASQLVGIGFSGSGFDALVRELEQL